jgi:peptidoglycan/xylan/chitin deacetylase (PgdA/CDA1 family)
MIVFDSDDFGCDHVISDQCQTRDCRKELDSLHYANPNFKATLFAVPHQMTYELAEWCKANNSWIEIALHGFSHSSNYECAEMTTEEFEKNIENLQPMIDDYFVKGFKAPGWQISDGVYEWLLDNDYWVADQAYNNVRRAKLARSMGAYVNNNGNFVAWNGSQDTDIYSGVHTHTWNCMGNGIEETYHELEEKIKAETDFKFISEIL